MMAKEDTAKKKKRKEKRDRHVEEEEVSHYQTQRIHLFSSCGAAAAVKRGTSGWRQRTISSKYSRGGSDKIKSRRMFLMDRWIS